MPFNETSLKLEITYLPDKCYFTLGSICFRQSIGIPMECYAVPLDQTYFWIIIKGSGFYEHKKGTCERLGLWMTYVLKKNKFENNYKDELVLK